MRINNAGYFEFCRWAKKTNRITVADITQVSPITFFQHNMRHVRTAMLQGESLPACSPCHDMERHDKVSGRQRQLLKTGIALDDFGKTMQSSPWYGSFRYAADHQGIINEMPQDWQIDLGNYCNSACIFCSPHSSSRLAAEFKSLGIIDQLPDPAWCDDEEKLAKFIDMIEATPKIAYLHFIGGETLITPAFRKILQSLVRIGMNKRISIGFTTNLTTWNQEITDLLCDFKEVNLGMSIECMHPLNDYLRYGSNLQRTLALLDKWIVVGKKQNWLMQLRITPTVFSIWHLDTVYEFAFDNNLSVESCNFLDNPPFMRASVLPADLISQCIVKLEKFILTHQTTITSETAVINTRHPDLIRQQVTEDACSYVNYLRKQPSENHRLPDLINYIKRLEQNRQNSILDYLPDYEKFLRAAGY